MLMFRTSPGPQAGAAACARKAVQSAAPGWHFNLSCRDLALERVVLWRAATYHSTPLEPAELHC